MDRCGVTIVTDRCIVKIFSWCGLLLLLTIFVDWLRIDMIYTFKEKRIKTISLRKTPKKKWNRKQKKIENSKQKSEKKFEKKNVFFKSNGRWWLICHAFTFSSNFGESADQQRCCFRNGFILLFLFFESAPVHKYYIDCIGFGKTNTLTRSMFEFVVRSFVFCFACFGLFRKYNELKSCNKLWWRHSLITFRSFRCDSHRYIPIYGTAPQLLNIDYWFLSSWFLFFFFCFLFLFHSIHSSLSHYSNFNDCLNFAIFVIYSFSFFFFLYDINPIWQFSATPKFRFFFLLFFFFSCYHSNRTHSHIHKTQYN